MCCWLFVFVNVDWLNVRWVIVQYIVHLKLLEESAERVLIYRRISSDFTRIRPRYECHANTLRPPLCASTATIQTSVQIQTMYHRGLITFHLCRKWHLKSPRPPPLSALVRARSRAPCARKQRAQRNVRRASSYTRKQMQTTTFIITRAAYGNF